MSDSEDANLDDVNFSDQQFSLSISRRKGPGG